MTTQKDTQEPFIDSILKCCENGELNKYYEKLQQFIDEGGDLKLISRRIQMKRDIKTFLKVALEDHNLTQSILKTREKFDIKPGDTIEINLFIEF